MAMGRRAKLLRQERLWIAHTELPRTVAHPFYEQLNRLLEEREFDEFVEQQCERFYAERMGRPSLVPERYFRLMLLIGYFEGMEGERGIAWRAADLRGAGQGVVAAARGIAGTELRARL
jgi:transposase